MSTQPITPELHQWLVEQTSQGTAATTLIESMCNAGWQESVAARALQQVLQPHRQPNQCAAAKLPDPAVADTSQFVDVGDCRVPILMQMHHPRIVLFGNVLDPHECAAIIAAARPRLMRSRTVATHTGGEEVNADRTSDGMFFRRGEIEVVARLEQRIAQLIHWPVENGEGLQVLRYLPGAQYKPHYDWFDPAASSTPALLQRGGQRIATLVIYLNNPLKGGGTTFPDAALEISPNQGNAVFFSYARPHSDTRTLHGGAPVLEGEKWIATKWLREREFI